jgi:hypothetical protein
MTLELWQQHELRELIPLLVEMEQPESPEKAAEFTDGWRAAGYEAVVSAWTYHHGRLRRAQEAA